MGFTPNIVTKFAKLIAVALLGKYTDQDQKHLFEHVRPLVVKLSNLDKNSIGTIATTPLDRDIVNQFKCLVRIETEWRCEPITLQHLYAINSIVQEIDPDRLQKRKLQYVRDFGGDAMTKPEEIDAGLKNIQKILDDANALDGSDFFALSTVLAHLFYSIIRIHPFEDGNGRTARFAVQLVLRKYQYDYLPIPKYRNDLLWRSALEDAKVDNISTMEIFFRDKIART